MATSASAIMGISGGLSMLGKVNDVCFNITSRCLRGAISLALRNAWCRRLPRRA